MDPRNTWFQPEQLGPATELWTNIFNSATRNFRDLSMGDGKSSDGSGLHENDTRTRVDNCQDFIPLHGYSVADYLATTKRSAVTNGYQNGERTSTSTASNNYFNKRRKDNLASTYDWNNSGKLREGGTPWWTRRNMGIQLGSLYPDLTNHNVGLGLGREIEDFYVFMYPRAEEHFMRSEVVTRIEGIVKSIWPESRLEIYGSYRTMLYLPTSDIDLVVFGDLGDCPYFRIGNELEKSKIAEMGTIKVLDKASVPIVKLTDGQTKVKVDISFNMRTGTACASLIEEFIRQYPCLPKLVFVLKQFLLQRDLNEVWTGGISSYSLILMAVSFLQMHVRPEPVNLGVQLIEFFELYGVNFNYFKTGISVTDGGCYFSKENARGQMIQGYRTSLLCIEDPLNPGTDICKSSYGFMEVRKAFSYAYSVLKQGLLTHLDHDEYLDSVLGRIVRITDEVIEYREWIRRNWGPKMPPPMLFPQNCMPNILLPPQSTVFRIGVENDGRGGGGNGGPLLLGGNALLNSAMVRGEDREDSPTDAGNANTDVVLLNGHHPLQGTESEVNSLQSSPDIYSCTSDTDSELSSHASGSSKESTNSSTAVLLKPLASSPPAAVDVTLACPQVQKPDSSDASSKCASQSNRTIKSLQMPAENEYAQIVGNENAVVTSNKLAKADDKLLVAKDDTVVTPATSTTTIKSSQSTSSGKSLIKPLPTKVYSNSNRNNYQQTKSRSGAGISSSNGGNSGSSGGIHHSKNGTPISRGSSGANSSSNSSNNNNANGKKLKRKPKQRDTHSGSMR